jgi:uncharacterized protein (TIGR02453 family)
MHFNGFPKKGLTFLNKIIVNNSKEWLDVNREEYERVIVTPNKAYIEEMGEHLQALVPTIHAIPKTNKSLFRIYRDARFHLADPIKTCIGVIFWQGSGHRMQSSSFYMHYDPQEIFVATGIRNFKPTLLSTYREYIQSEERRSELHNILEVLKAKGYKIPEAKYKRMPRDCDSKDSNSYLYLMGALYAYTTFPPDNTFHSEAIIDRNFKVYEDMLELQQWIYELTLHCDTEADVYR